MKNKLPPGTYGAATFEIGDRIGCGQIEISSAKILDFAALTGDQFEIHMSDAAAQKHGFAKQVAHGLLVLSLVDGMKNNAPVQISARASKEWNWKFKAPVLAGDLISAELTIVKISPARHPEQAVLHLEFSVTNQDGVTVQTGTNKLLAYR